jgi:hypothetical protein
MMCTGLPLLIFIASFYFTSTISFVIRAPPNCHMISYVDRLRPPTVLCSEKESNSAEIDDSNTDNPTTIPNLKLQMGASIGAENVGNMLFNEEILKGGRGDVRVGSIGRWKDFKGNEIVRNQDLTSE